MKKIVMVSISAIAALSMSGCGLVKDWYMFVDEVTCQQARAGRAESTFKEGKCPEKNEKGGAKITGFCQDAKDEDLRVHVYAPLTNEDLKGICTKILPGSTFKEK